MDLALNNLQRLICHKTQITNQPTNQPTKCISTKWIGNDFEQDLNSGRQVHLDITPSVLHFFFEDVLIR